MDERTEGSKYSEDAENEQHVTLARALEEAHSAKEATLALKNEILEELEMFRRAMREEVAERDRRFDAHDVLMVLGMAALCGGVAVAFHWAYSLMIGGVVVMSIALLPLVGRPREP